MSQTHVRAAEGKKLPGEAGCQNEITDIQCLADTIITFERYFGRTEEPAKQVVRAIGSVLSRTPTRDTMIQIQAAVRLVVAAITRREEQEVERLTASRPLNLRQGK